MRVYVKEKECVCAHVHVSNMDKVNKTSTKSKIFVLNKGIPGPS